MKRRLWIAAVLLGLLLLGTGCQKETVSEAKAVDAARALLTQAYGGEIPAVEDIELYTVDNARMRPHYDIHFVEKDGNSYFARVSARTGLCYQAERDRSALPMSEAQRAEAEALGDIDSYSDNFGDDEIEACKQAALAFAGERFAQGRTISGVEFEYDLTDSTQFPLVDVGHLIYFDDGGGPLHVDVVWPQLSVFSVGYDEP